MNSLAALFITPPLWLALLFAVGIALLAWAVGALSVSGAAAAFVIGGIVFGAGGGYFAIPLLAFFLSSSLLSKWSAKRKPVANTPAAKGATRDVWQVLANGGLAALVVLVWRLTVYSHPFYETRLLLMLFLAALATANADTWATEIGALSGAMPRLLSNWKPVAPGASGAISGPGTCAALAGAFFIPLCVLPFWHLDAPELLTVAWAGFLGCAIDSLLGASLQAQYRDAETGDVTERSTTNEKPNVLLRGLPWFTNDVVNFLATVGGVLCAYALLRYAAYPFH